MESLTKNTCNELTSRRDRYGVFRLTEADRPAFTAQLLGLSPAARRLRFGLELPDLLVKKFASGVPLQGCAWGLFVWGELKGSVILLPVPGGSGRGELALALDKSLRSRGWGAVLTNTALSHAQDRGMRVVEVNYLAENRAMARIASSYPGVTIHDQTERVKEVDLDQWDPAQNACCA